MRRILATGTPTALRPRTVSRSYKRPAVAKPERTKSVDPLAVIPTKVVYAPTLVDKDSVLVEEGGVTGRMLAQRAADAMAQWSPRSGKAPVPKWLTEARKRNAALAKEQGVATPAPRDTRILSGVLLGQAITK